MPNRNMLRRLVTRSAAVLVVGISLLFVATMTRISELDFLTGSSRTSYRAGPFEVHGFEHEEPWCGWARGKLADQSRRRWVFSCSEPVFPFGGYIACGRPFDGVASIWSLEVPDVEKDALLREWHRDVDGSRDRSALRAVERRWLKRFEN